MTWPGVTRGSGLRRIGKEGSRRSAAPGICQPAGARFEAHVRSGPARGGRPEGDRKALLGHTEDGSISSHYSAALLTKLIEYAIRIAADTRGPALTVAKSAGWLKREVPSKGRLMRKGVSD